ncbi:MAG: RHS repeat protein, partial [Flavobacteriaceae bacterium]|nr:RHS repeat protein [Flavobacteriaceae bacterium]
IEGAVIFADQYGAKPGSPYTYAQGNHAGYSYVTEYIDSENEKGEGGKIEYSFTSMQDGGDFYKPPYTLPVDNEWLRGKPLKIKQYKKENTTYNLIKQEEFVYKYADHFGHVIITDPLLNQSSNPLYYNNDYLQFNIPLIVFKLNEQNPASSDENDYKVYNLNGGVQKLFSTKSTLYNNGFEFTNTTTNNFNYETHYQLTHTETTDSKGNLIKTKTDYPQDKVNLTNLTTDASVAIDSLIAQHRISEPIQTEITVSDTNGNELSKSIQRTNYRDWGNDIVLPEFIQTSKGSASLENRIVYHDYDDKGNPLEVSKFDGTHITYIWGYQKSQPIAKIENATYSQVLSQVANLQDKSNLDNDRTHGSLGNEGSLRTALSNLRASLPDAMVTTYTYDPLIGVTSITDPRGYTIYYEYDDFNRLKEVKDAEGNIVSKNEYHYKN